MASRKRGKVLHSDARQIAYNVIKYFEEERRLERYHPLQFSNARASMATDLDPSLISKIKKEAMLRSRIFQAYNALQKLPGAAFMSDTSKPMDTTYMEIPVYDITKPQTLDIRKSRLHYQSRKRGMLENDLILSTFAKKHLDTLSEEQTLMYDKLINSPSNDWDIFHWIVEKVPTPKEFDNEIMDLLKQHAKNHDKVALCQPPLH